DGDEPAQPESPRGRAPRKGRDAAAGAGQHVDGGGRRAHRPGRTRPRGEARSRDADCRAGVRAIVRRTRAEGSPDGADDPRSQEGELTVAKKRSSMAVHADEIDSKLYRSISEVSDMLDVKPHVLRYWETQFSMLRPRKNRAGNRVYRPEDLKILFKIRELLYDRRFTIEGARKRLLGEKKDAPPGPQVEMGFADAERKLIVGEIKRELIVMLQKLRERTALRA